MPHKRTESFASKFKDVIIVGAGLSGLSAAKICHDKGLNVLVLEARERVGGRTLSDESGCDLGGSYFIQDHRNLFNLIAELSLKYQADLPAATGGAPVFYSNEKKVAKRCDDPSDLPFASRYNFIARLDYLATKRKINSLCMKINLSEPWNTKDAEKLDSITFKQYINTTCLTSQVKKYFLEFVAPINFTSDAEDCSLLYALYFIRAWGGLEKLIGLGSDGTSRVVGGSQLLSVRLRQQIGEERVLLNKPVHTIDQQNNSEFVTVIAKDGTKYESSRVIVAVPPNIQTTITFKPQQPLKSQLNHRTPAGLCTKVILFYDRAYWSDNGFNGYMSVMDHKRTIKKRKTRIARTVSKKCENRRSVCKTSSSSDKDETMYSSTNSLLVPSSNGDKGAVANLMLKETKETYYPEEALIAEDEDYCPVSFVMPDYSRGQPSLIAHICGSAWINYHQIEKQEDRIALVAKSYGKIMHPKLSEPLSFKELDWVSEEYTRGAYTSIMTPGTMTKFGRALFAPYGRVAFACTELSTYWPCTMEGAIRSGRKAAIKILKDLQRVDVNEEDILDDEEAPIQLSDNFIEKNAHHLLHLTVLAIPVLLIGLFGMHRISAPALKAASAFKFTTTFCV